MVAEQSGLLAAFNAGETGLCFGRLVFRDGADHHIGRIGLREDDPRRTPLVVDWRAEVARPFYLATGHEPMGLSRRRHITTKGREVVSLHVRRVGSANELTWTDSTVRARTFYRVYRSSPGGFSDMVCEPRGVARCDLRAETLTTTRERRFVDRMPPPGAVYRVGVAANWLDETERGDVFAISPPAVASPGS